MILPSRQSVSRFVVSLLLVASVCLVLPACSKPYGGKATDMTVIANPEPEKIYVIRHSDWLRNGQQDLLTVSQRKKLEQLTSRTSGKSPLNTTLYRDYQYMFIVQRGPEDLVAYGPHKTSGVKDEYTISD